MAESRKISGIKNEAQSRPKMDGKELVSDTVSNLSLEKRKELNELLLESVRNENFAEVKRLLRAGANIKVLIFNNSLNSHASGYDALVAAKKTDPELNALITGKVMKPEYSIAKSFADEAHIYTVMGTDAEIFVSKFNACISK